MITSYDKMNVRTYLECRDIQMAQDVEDIDKQIALIGVLADMDEVEVMKMKVPEFQRMIDKIQFLRKPIAIRPPAKEYRVNGMILIPIRNSSDMTAKQYITFQQLYKSDDLVKMLTVFLVPKGKVYGDGYEMADVEKAIMDMNIVDAFSASAFFLRFYKKLIRNTLISLVWRTMLHPWKMRKERKESIRLLIHLLRNGDGLRG